MLVLQQEIGNVYDWFAVAVMVQPATMIVGCVYTTQQQPTCIPYYVIISTGKYYNCLLMNINEQELVWICDGSD